MKRIDFDKVYIIIPEDFIKTEESIYIPIEELENRLKEIEHLHL